MNTTGANAKIIWTKKMIAFIHRNYHQKTNQQIADALGLKLTTVRMKIYELGYKRIELEYWTKEQVVYLRNNYKKKGDKEIAEIFNQLFPKNKKWTLKHICKKRKYLKLTRTSSQLQAIKDRAIEAGVYRKSLAKRWSRDQAKEGEIRYWNQYGRMVPRVKINGRFIHWARWAYVEAYGELAKGMNVVFADRNTYNQSISNLILLTDAQLAKRNALTASTGLSDNYVAGMMSFKDKELRADLKQFPDLIQSKRTHLLLNRKLKSLQNEK